MTSTHAVPPDSTPAGMAQAGGLGAQAAPWAAMGCLLVAAGAARLAVGVTGADREVALAVAAVAFTTAVVVAHKARRRINDRRLRHRLVAAAYLGAAWLTAVTLAGVTLGAVAALTIFGAGLSLLWWRENRIDGTAFTPPTLVEPSDDDLYIGRWARNLGAEGRKFAGSSLASPEIIRAGYRYTLNLVPGVHAASQAANAVETLRGGLRLLPGQEVIVEEHPDLPAPTAVLTVVTKSPIKKPRMWPGPTAAFDATTGRVNLGPFVDDEGIACWTVYRLDGMFGGYIQGAPGSGKSRMIESIAMAAAASESHPTVVWFGCGQNGDSSPMLVGNADYSATTYEQIHNMLTAAVQVMKINGAENRANRRVGFKPTAARPGLLVIVDECHNPLDPALNPLLAGATQKLMATIAREGRKVGVALILASQSPTLDAFGGAGNNADVLRASLLAGNGVILRSETQNAKQVFNVEVNPRSFPKLPGYAFLSNPEPGARSAPFRGYWVTDELADAWPGRIGWRPLPARQANVAGKVYARRREIAAEQVASDLWLLEMADAGLLDDVTGLAAPAASGVPAGTVDVGGEFPPIRRVERFWMPEERTPAGLLPGQQKVLESIRAGCQQPKDIQAATGYSESQVYNLLGDLQRSGCIGKAGYGRYEALAA